MEHKKYSGEKPATFFAPAERVNASELARQRAAVAGNPLFDVLQEAVDGFLMVLNRQRQVLAANRALLEFAGAEDESAILGRRPGEVLGCIHAESGPSGCGTSRFCATCGSVLAILTSQQEGRPVVRECLATLSGAGKFRAREFRVRATPVHANGDEFTALVFSDISSEKRRDALERMFLHDIINTASGVSGLSKVLTRIDAPSKPDIAQRIATLSRRLIEDVKTHRCLAEAERGEMRLTPREVSPEQILALLAGIFERHESTADKQLVFEQARRPSDDDDAPAAGYTLSVDVSLLLRVLTSMVKNALEATEPDHTVRVWYERRGDHHVFLVKNPGSIPESTQLQIFRRSFSTKGEAGRGIGTYSMKLFGERYLGGKVSFASDPEHGTVFWIEL